MRGTFGCPSPVGRAGLGCGVQVGAAVDVVVAELGRAVIQRRRRSDRDAVDRRLPIGIDGRADGRVAVIDPHRRAEVAGGDRVVVVAEELDGQAFGAGAVGLKVSELVEVRNFVVSALLDIFGRPGRVGC